MKLAIKRIYCPTCQKLSHISEEKTAAGISFICQKCKNTIWTKDNFAWRHFNAPD